ncbi:hypothetical protein FHS43_006065 [Streptosporangium becharense]|uniref:Uncharacterized protein n=1 Tax=Streptosporangium becharense TaxID=1816182 RepID=A0A7W9IHU0_9ACTN|nr:ATP-binding protein [Streptosporangium becharense]MBB2914753.1 hypothetical protein [Streptosporangium becharense]MBB5820846.1 hypothetical protein [Streptosporangium becharense]
MSYEHSLPGVLASIRKAQEWIQFVASPTHPDLARDAGEVIGELMAIAIRRTPENVMVRLKATPSLEGLTVEIRDPGLLYMPDGPEWAKLSTRVWTARCSRDETGHLIEVEIRSRQAVPP